MVGRSAQFQHIVEILARSEDLLITGVPGCGRRTLVRTAASEVGAIALEVDCIRATAGRQLIQLLAEAISQSFDSTLLQTWVNTIAKDLFTIHVDENSTHLRLASAITPKQLWQAFERLIQLPQLLAEVVNKRVVLILQSFPHLRSWDRNSEWENTLRREIKSQTRVSYVLIATIAEIAHTEDYPLEVVELTPLADEVLAVWARGILHTQGLTFDARSQAIDIFINAVQGHIGDAMTLIRRLVTLQCADGLISDRQVRQAIQGLLQDLSNTFESLLMLLPASQLQLLECLALDPTSKPQSREYIQKHGLSRGGSLQGALIGLQQKGLIYSAEQNYRLALPFFALWLRQRLSE
ncbi:ATP-binding protein [Gloeocapsopsis crepidinum]|uniref:ATP-binding protein n=1 Tax=Gloeocapsopsis crepidinum TaxID=693223 RepID=UPI003F6F4E98